MGNLPMPSAITKETIDRLPQPNHRSSHRKRSTEAIDWSVGHMRWSWPSSKFPFKFECLKFSQVMSHQQVIKTWNCFGVPEYTRSILASESYIDLSKLVEVRRLSDGVRSFAFELLNQERVLVNGCFRKSQILRLKVHLLRLFSYLTVGQPLRADFCDSSPIFLRWLLIHGWSRSIDSLQSSE